MRCECVHISVSMCENGYIYKRVYMYMKCTELQLYVHPIGVATNFNDLVTRLKRQRSIMIDQLKDNSVLGEETNKGRSNYIFLPPQHVHLSLKGSPSLQSAVKGYLLRPRKD